MSKKNLVSIFIIICTICCSTLTFARTNRIRSITAYNKRYVYLSDVARYYGMVYLAVKGGAKLKSKYSEIDFTYGKRKGKLNGVVVNYLSAPFFRNGEAMISEKDFLLLIDPILRYKALKRHPVKTIVIDPGHGGKDDGTSGKYSKEKDVVLSLARKLRWLLRKNGYNVLLTRDSDVKIPLEKRPAFSNAHKGDLFISIHCNSAGKDVKGIETYILTPKGSASTTDIKTSNDSFSGNKNDKNNIRLGYEIQHSLINKTKTVDRGLHYARFCVLKTINVPAVLVETGYLSNKEEEHKLCSDAYQNTIVSAIYEGIVRYHRDMVRR